MISYKLAKQLKDAGYPQEGNTIFCGIHLVGNCNEWDDDCEKSHVISPTLSELIEACGDELTSLLATRGNKTHWSAMRKQELAQENYPYFGSGKTPEEAVANLWLQINKK